MLVSYRDIMTVMHIDFRIPIVPNGSCYGSDFEVFEIFF